MPRTGPRRELVSVRMHAEAIALLDEIAEAEGILDERGRPNRSEVIRRLCKEALASRATK